MNKQRLNKSQCPPLIPHHVTSNASQGDALARSCRYCNFLFSLSDNWISIYCTLILDKNSIKRASIEWEWRVNAAHPRSCRNKTDSIGLSHVYETGRHCVRHCLPRVPTSLFTRALLDILVMIISTCSWLIKLLMMQFPGIEKITKNQRWNYYNYYKVW